MTLKELMTQDQPPVGPDMTPVAMPGMPQIQPIQGSAMGGIGGGIESILPLLQHLVPKGVMGSNDPQALWERTPPLPR